MPDKSLEMLRTPAKLAFAAISRMALRGATILFKFGLSLFLAKYFGLDVVGAYGLILGMTALTPTIIRIGVFNSIARDSVTQSRDELALELHYYYSCIVGAYIVLTIVAVALIPIVAPSISQAGAFLVCCIVLAEHITLEACTLLTNRGRLSAALTFSLIQTLCWGIPLILLSYSFPAFRTLETLLVCWAFGAWAPLLLLALTLRTQFVPQQISGAAATWFFQRARSASPLYGADLAANAAQYLDRYIIGIFFGLKEAGIYFLFLQVANAILNLVSSSIVQSYRPNLIAAYHRRKVALANIVSFKLRRATLMTLLVASVASGVLFPHVLNLIGRPEVGEQNPLLWAVLAAMICKTIHLLNMLTLFAQRRDGALFGFGIAIIVLVSAFSFIAAQTGSLYAFPAANALAYLTLIAVKSAYFDAKAVAVTMRDRQSISRHDAGAPVPDHCP